MFGFVIIRHVDSSITDEYWKHCYSSIRNFYDNPILIVDDNSNKFFLNDNITLINCQTVNSEFTTVVGELLGYYYFHKTHFVEKALVIHDSVFIKKYIDFNVYGNAKTLWSFQNNPCPDNEIINLINLLDNS